MLFCKVCFIVCALISCVICAICDNYDRLKYNVPEPQIQVFRPRGLEVSIPDTPGLQLFAFHGNINKPMDPLSAGQLSRDVTQKHDDGLWTFQDTSIKLKPGDKIYYWIFVIKDDLGYRSDNGFFEVKDITTKSFRPNANSNNNNDNKNNSISNSDPHANSPENEAAPVKNEGDLELCSKVVLNLTQTVLDFKYQVDTLMGVNNILRDMVEKNSNSPLNLYLEGRIPQDEDPGLLVQQIVRQKLKLPITILNARKNGKTKIQFQAPSINDKVDIILAAKDKLKDSMFVITY